ncbi:MAG: segregation/condensation protein A [Patescibacteria group bacterium]
MTYELRIERFTGPLSKLLELIEAREMDITDVSLAEVTDDFLKYLRTISESKVDLRMISDFIAVASRLILIKSKVLLPEFSLTSDEEAEIKNLEERLKIYRDFKPGMKAVNNLWRNSAREYGRPYFLMRGLSSEGGAGFFYPGENLNLGAVVSSLNKIFDGLKAFVLETETVREKIITIEEKIAEIVERMKKEGESSFMKISGEKPRREIIAIFLAILHLAREQLVSLEQNGHFSDIIIKKSGSLPKEKQTRKRTTSK